MLKFDSNSFFISDPHFSHKNICKGESVWKDGYRNFLNTKQMNDTILNNINKEINKNSTLFILGDGFFGKKEETIKICENINCNLVYLMGNHSDWIRNNNELQNKYFKYCVDYLEIVIERQLICLFHYPCVVWRDSHKGSWQLHGHCHATLPESSNDGLRLEVSADCAYWTKKNALYKSDSHGTIHLPEHKTAKVDETYQLEHAPFCPFSFAQLKFLMSFKQKVFKDHHDSTTT